MPSPKFYWFSLGLVSLLGSLIGWSQEQENPSFVNGTLDPISNDPMEGDDPLAGGTRVVNIVNTGTGNQMNDYHICVGSREYKADPPATRTEGDPVNGNYRASPVEGDTPEGWEFRGVQVVDLMLGGEGTATSYLTWVKTEGSEADGAELRFGFDYKGCKEIKKKAEHAIFTHNGNGNPIAGEIAKGDAYTIASALPENPAEPPAEAGTPPVVTPGPFLLSVIIGALLGWLIMAIFLRGRKNDLSKDSGSS